ncbi:acyltransferase [uncultured Desulfovibrio sp.]|uniref:acyltransferase family protein n=1 Tax=uncultured Desulfovibrio sp. TaxID=167968 RepID=UPI002628F107|nr:acyltransferase [uncultured Desulfovibrio sp.]
MTQKKYDLTFHYFRAFAILSVMLTHMWVGPLLDDDGSSGKLLDSLRQCLFHSSTIYFIFISGYLFDHVNRRRAFRLLRFYKAKLLHVFCPYCVLSLLLLGTAWVAHNAFHIDIAFINEGTPVASLADVLECLCYGTACLVPYWYIPFILSVFSISPVIHCLRDSLLRRIMVPAAILPLLVPRGLLFFFRNYCFFFPVFLLGVVFSRHRGTCMAFIRQHIVMIRLVAVFTSLLILLDCYHSFIPNIEAAFYVQKLCIGSWILDVLEDLDREVAALDLLAQCSFPLFFLHVIFQNLLQDHLFVLFSTVLSRQTVLVATLTAGTEIVLCLLCILLIRRLLGRHSRYVIGG